MFSSCRQQDSVCVTGHEWTVTQSSRETPITWQTQQRQQHSYTMREAQAPSAHHDHPWYQYELQHQMNGSFASPHYPYPYRQQQQQQQENYQFANQVDTQTMLADNVFCHVDDLQHGRLTASALESSVQPHCDGLRRVMTSFRPSWRECGTHEHPSYYDVDFETGSSCVAPRDLLTAKMTSFGRRIRELQSSSSDGCLVSAASSAYHRWSTAIETERRRDRVTGVGHSGRPHAEGMYDDVHAWLIDTLDTAVQHASVLACDLATGLSLTMSTDHYSSLYRSFMDVQTLLRRVTNSLQLTHHQQVNVDDNNEVDTQIVSLLLGTITDNDELLNFETLDLNTSFRSSIVDQTSSPSAGLQPWPVSTATTQQTFTGGPSTSTENVSSVTLAPLRRRRSRQPHTKAAVALMTAWYDEHRHRPYASDAEVRRLAIECGLEVRQVQKWLSNRRRMDGNTKRRSRPAHNSKSRLVC